MTPQEAMVQVRGRWQSLPPEQRRLAAWGGAAAALILAGGLWLSSYTPYTTVYTGLSPAAAGQVVQALGQMKVPYRLNGTSIAVPTAQADQVRVTLATQGLPQTGQVGYQNVLSSVGFGMSDQQFNLAVLNALQEDLATTIETMQGVRLATVEVVEPAQSVFALPAPSAAKASVYVEVGPGGGLSASEVRGIVQLVSHAVPGLSPGAVTVVDQYGQLLSQPTAAATGATPQLRAEQAVENMLAGRIEALLTPVVGPGNLSASVHVTLGFTRVRTVEHLTTAAGPRGKGVVLSQTGSVQTFSGTGSAATPAGLAGNVPTYPAAAATGPSKYTTRQSSVRYAVDRIERTVVGQPMTLGTVTASILINQKAFTATPARLAQIRALVASALGLTGAAAAKDVAVAAVPFAATPLPSGPTPFLPTLPEVAGGALGAVLLGLILGFLGGRRRRVVIPAGEPAPLPLPAAGTPAAALAAGAETDADRKTLQGIAAQARENPEGVAELLRGWLREDA